MLVLGAGPAPATTVIPGCVGVAAGRTVLSTSLSCPRVGASTVAAAVVASNGDVFSLVTSKVANATRSQLQFVKVGPNGLGSALSESCNIIGGSTVFLSACPKVELSSSALDMCLMSPQGMAIASNNDLWIADTYNARVVRVVAASGTFLVPKPADAGSNSRPLAIAVSVTGDVLYVDGFYKQVYLLTRGSGLPVAVLGAPQVFPGSLLPNPQYNPSLSYPSLSLNASLVFPTSVAWTQTGGFVVGDFATGSLLHVNSSKMLTSFPLATILNGVSMADPVAFTGALPIAVSAATDGTGDMFVIVEFSESQDELSVQLKGWLDLYNYAYPREETTVSTLYESNGWTSSSSTTFSYSSTSTSSAPEYFPSWFAKSHIFRLSSSLLHPISVASVDEVQTPGDVLRPRFFTPFTSPAFVGLVASTPMWSHKLYAVGAAPSPSIVVYSSQNDATVGYLNTPNNASSVYSTPHQLSCVSNVSSLDACLRYPSKVAWTSSMMYVVENEYLVGINGKSSITQLIALSESAQVTAIVGESFFSSVLLAADGHRGILYSIDELTPSVLTIFSSHWGTIVDLAVSPDAASIYLTNGSHIGAAPLFINTTFSLIAGNFTGVESLDSADTVTEYTALSVRINVCAMTWFPAVNGLVFVDGIGLQLRVLTGFPWQIRVLADVAAPVTWGAFTSQSGVAVSSQGTVYFSDGIYSLWSFTENSGVAIVNANQQEYGVGEKGAQLSTTLFNGLTGIALDQFDNLFMCDYYSALVWAASTGVQTSNAIRCPVGASCACGAPDPCTKVGTFCSGDNPAPLFVTPGHYSVAISSPLFPKQVVYGATASCSVGYMCVGAVQTPCPPGTIGQSWSYESTACIPCPANTFNPLEVGTSCIACPSGTFSLEGAAYCAWTPESIEEITTACPEGQRALLGPFGGCQDTSGAFFSNPLVLPGSVTMIVEVPPSEFIYDPAANDKTLEITVAVAIAAVICLPIFVGIIMWFFTLCPVCDRACKPAREPTYAFLRGIDQVRKGRWGLQKEEGGVPRGNQATDDSAHGGG